MLIVFVIVLIKKSPNPSPYLTRSAHVWVSVSDAVSVAVSAPIANPGPFLCPSSSQFPCPPPFPFHVRLSPRRRPCFRFHRRLCCRLRFRVRCSHNARHRSGRHLTLCLRDRLSLRDRRFPNTPPSPPGPVSVSIPVALSGFVPVSVFAPLDAAHVSVSTSVAVAVAISVTVAVPGSIRHTQTERKKYRQISRNNPNRLPHRQSDKQANRQKYTQTD